MLLHLSSWQNWFFSQSWLQPYVVCPRWQILASTWISKDATEWFCKSQRSTELGQSPAIGSLCKLPKVHPYALGSLKLDCIGDFAGFEQIIGIYKHIDSVTGRRHLMEKKSWHQWRKISHFENLERNMIANETHAGVLQLRYEFPTEIWEDVQFKWRIIDRQA